MLKPVSEIDEGRDSFPSLLPSQRTSSYMPVGALHSPVTHDKSPPEPPAKMAVLCCAPFRSLSETWRTAGLIR